MKSKSLFPLALALLVSMTIGCGSSGPTSVADGASDSAIAEYEKLLAEDQAAMEGTTLEDE